MNPLSCNKVMTKQVFATWLYYNNFYKDYGLFDECSNPKYQLILYLHYAIQNKMIIVMIFECFRLKYT
jgi:hypothetical protein